MGSPGTEQEAMGGTPCFWLSLQPVAQVTVASHTGLGGNVGLWPSGTEHVALRGQTLWTRRSAHWPERGAWDGAGGSEVGQSEGPRQAG